MKKLVSILLALVMIFGMTVGVSAATVTSGIRGINESDFAAQLAQNAEQGKIMLNDKTKLSLADLTDLEPSPGDVIKIYMTGNLFVDKDKKVTGTYADNVSKSALTSADIGVRLTANTGEGVAEVAIEGNKSNSYIKIEFSKSPEYLGKKFAYSLYLSYRGSRKSATRIALKGSLVADEIEVDSGDFYADLSGGATVKATTSVRGIELDLGEYCSVIRNLTRGKTYAGIATTDILPQDEEVFFKYKDLDYIYRLKTVGLKASGNIVKFNLDDTFYVYNTNGAYIGTTDKMLPYWTKYYLTSTKYDKIEIPK